MNRVEKAFLHVLILIDRTFTVSRKSLETLKWRVETKKNYEKVIGPYLNALILVEMLKSGIKFSSSFDGQFFSDNIFFLPFFHTFALYFLGFKKYYGMDNIKKK